MELQRRQFCSQIDKNKLKSVQYTEQKSKLNLRNELTWKLRIPIGRTKTRISGRKLANCCNGASWNNPNIKRFKSKKFG
jgi:hypothetical protein